MAEKTLSEILKEAMEKPKAVAADGESVSQFQLSELIEAANAISSIGKKPGTRLRIMKPTGNSAV